MSLLTCGVKVTEIIRAVSGGVRVRWSVIPTQPPIPGTTTIPPYTRKKSKEMFTGPLFINLQAYNADADECDILTWFSIRWIILHFLLAFLFILKDNFLCANPWSLRGWLCCCISLKIRDFLLGKKNISLLHIETVQSLSEKKQNNDQLPLICPLKFVDR